MISFMYLQRCNWSQWVCWSYDCVCWCAVFYTTFCINSGASTDTHNQCVTFYKKCVKPSTAYSRMQELKSYQNWFTFTKVATKRLPMGVFVSHNVVMSVQEFPFKPHKRYSLDYVRQFPHLRPRTLFFSSLLRIRNAATMAVHKYFQASYIMYRLNVCASYYISGLIICTLWTF